MTRLNILAWTIVGVLAWANGAAAADFQLNRDWVGKFNVSVGVFGGPSFGTRVMVPSLLESVLDDTADTYTVESLDYMDASEDFNRFASQTSNFVIVPNDFPGQSVTKSISETLKLTHVAWLDVPSYSQVDPAPLSFVSFDSWRANPDTPTPLDPILLRLVGQYQGTVDGVTVTEPFDETIELDPGQLPQFRFSTGNNYPQTLFFGADRSFGQGHSVDINVLVGGAPRTIRLTGQFVHVPEPGTIALTLIASGGPALCRGWRRRMTTAGSSVAIRF